MGASIMTTELYLVFRKLWLFGEAMWGWAFNHIHSRISIMSPLFIEHLDIFTQNFETKFSIVKLPRYYLYHP